jgi:deoxyribose-phosphate aldolase
MDHSTVTNQLFGPVDPREIDRLLDPILSARAETCTRAVYEFCLGCLDVTSLGAADTPADIAALARKVADFNRHFPHLPPPATVCVHPDYVEVAGLALDGSETGITSVGGGFPVSKTFLEVKVLECAMAEENGADEIDVVIDLGRFLEGKYDLVAGEIETIRRELDANTVLKVIIESGMLPSPDDVRKASVLAMAAGADMIKTSTGINGPGASPRAVAVMCRAIADYYAFSGRRVGIKVAGGVRAAEDAALYYAIVKALLGEEWLDPEFFRIGASALADNLLSAIEGKEIKYF